MATTDEMARIWRERQKNDQRMRMQMAAYQEAAQNYPRMSFTTQPMEIITADMPKQTGEEVKEVKVDVSHFDRVVMPRDMVEEIVAVLKQHEKKKILLEDWGLSEVLEYGLGMGILMWGPPGTGKTATAHVIAKALDQKLKVYGAAELDSQIPGEYERNVKKAFAEAKKKGEVILFDECDSMLQSREGMGQIMSAQSNCLLTEIEQHDGVVILTTNRIQTLDEALERRISLILEFKPPTQEQREAIWNTLLPKKMPLAKDVKVKDLSEFTMTGGQIKNVIVNAARFALARDADKVENRDFDRAINRTMESKQIFNASAKQRGKQREFVQSMMQETVQEDKVKGGKVRRLV